MPARLRSLRPPIVALVVCGAALIGLAGCSSSRPEHLHEGGGDRTASKAHTQAGGSQDAEQDASVSMVIPSGICAVGHAPVHIRSVTAHHPSQGFVVRDWGVTNVDHDGDLGAADGPLARLGDYRDRSVTRRCHNGQTYSEIAVEVARTSGTTGRAEGFDVHYREGSSARTLWIGFTITLTTAKHKDHATHA